MHSVYAVFCIFYILTIVLSWHNIMNILPLFCPHKKQKAALLIGLFLFKFSRRMRKISSKKSAYKGASIAGDDFKSRLNVNSLMRCHQHIICLHGQCNIIIVFMSNFYIFKLQLSNDLFIYLLPVLNQYPAISCAHLTPSAVWYCFIL